MTIYGIELNLKMTGMPKSSITRSVVMISHFLFTIVLAILLLITIVKLRHSNAEIKKMRELDSRAAIAGLDSKRTGITYSGQSMARANEVLHGVIRDIPNVTPKPIFNTTDPMAAARRRKITERLITRNLGPFIASLNLSPDIRHRVSDLLVERSLILGDTQQLLAQQKITNPDERAESVRAATADINSQIEAALGQDGGSKFQDIISYNDSYTSISSSVGLDMAFAGLPMTQDQTIALAKLSAQLKYSPEPEPIPPGLAPQETVEAKEAFFANAATFLSPDQIAILRSNDEVKSSEQAMLNKTLANILSNRHPKQ